MSKKLLFCVAICALLYTPLHAQNSAVINFTTNIGPSGYSGVDGLNPFVDGSTTNQLVSGAIAGDNVERLDWLKFNGQIAIKNFTGDGTYTITPDGMGDGGIALMSPLLNRIEMDSWRTEGGLSAASIAAGGGRFDGATTQNRDDIYLPDFTPNGTATVTISGSNVNIDYLLDFNTLPFENSLFLRNGDTDTDISQALAANNARFRSIGVNGSGSAATSTATIGVDDGDIPFGVFFNLDPVLAGNLSNTLADQDFFGANPGGALTRGIINNELLADNITSDGRLASDPSTDTVLLSDPFADESGTVTFFDLTGGPDLAASIVVEAIPEPSSTLILISGLGALCLGRRRQ